MFIPTNVFNALQFSHLNTYQCEIAAGGHAKRNIKFLLTKKRKFAGCKGSTFLIFYVGYVVLRNYGRNANIKSSDTQIRIET